MAKSVTAYRVLSTRQLILWLQAAFMEYLKKSPRLQHVPPEIPQNKEALFLNRLEYYRQLYRPTCDQSEPESER